MVSGCGSILHLLWAVTCRRWSIDGRWHVSLREIYIVEVDDLVHIRATLFYFTCQKSMARHNQEYSLPYRGKGKGRSFPISPIKSNHVAGLGQPQSTAYASY